MDCVPNYPNTDDSLRFSLLSEKLITVTQSRICDRKLLDGYFKNINEIDYRKILIRDNNAIMLLINQLCSIIQPSETSLVKGYSQFLTNLLKRGVVLKDRTFTACKRWLLECLEFSEPEAAINLLCALQIFFITGPFDSIAQDLRKLLRDNSVLLKYIYPKNLKWDQEEILAVSCLKAIIINMEKSEKSIAPELSAKFKTIALQILSKLHYEDVDKLYFNNITNKCLRILRTVLPEKSLIDDADIIGELLGVVQAYIFHGIDGYAMITPQILRPATMNLPEMIQRMPKNKYYRYHKIRNKKAPSKKVETKTTSPPETKLGIKCSSDSDTSDTENNYGANSESVVRSQAARLLNTLILQAPNRAIFGFWTQIVASGSKTDARVLTRCILKEPLGKNRQITLSSLNDLLLGAKMFLSHAEDVEKMSFVTVFGMLSSVIEELHYTLSLVMSTERNVVVLTQAIKCANSLAQVTPYSRLKPGLATKLVRNCRIHLFHKDPSVRVGALSVFETLTLSDPTTPEIFNILTKSSNFDNEIDIELANSGFNTANDTDTEEVVPGDYDENISQINFDTNDDGEQTQISALVKVCLKYAADESVNEPVRFQSLKLLGTLTFNISSLIFSHLETITGTLVNITKQDEPQVAFHACRVLEIMASRLADSKSEDISKFWNIAFDPVISLVQHPQFLLRDVACDCLGNIGDEMIARLPRNKSILIITILFGATKDEECAVRAAALRALGLLVNLPTLEEDTGFLMDMVDITCTGAEDSNLGVRVKAIWALASLCDCLVNRENKLEVEPIPLEIVLPKLYKATVKAAQDHEKVKCNAVRAIGNVLYLCSDKSFLPDTSVGLSALIDSATTGNDMKVRWNACHALGIILSRDPDKVLSSSWKDQVFPALCDLICNNRNFKVRTNSAWALSVCNSFDRYIVTLWKSVMLALENSQHVPSYIEYSHRDALVQQLCLTLCHLAVHTDISELEPLWIEIKDHFEDISHHIKHFQEHILPEKAGELIKAKTKFASFVQQSTKSSEKQFATQLLELFKKEEKYDDINTVPF
ncbi:HEAT repeat-containing protein 6 [Phymastichus coffea]|uniref:HEAT repeat-containing protein 6 n=1 Tax=Phymastichus coffea TaxID=108790 RepID=UPI00273B7AFF|nr:HEAT repeat-containing protein 6 [Phymastichus coffea]XP_058793545.1 HEAT repeat-containing protein 6 [Phymastichus coffea]XP_058793555.1 HEAT repeat-containing protein 6 [Phymastichus coffea]